VIIGPREHAAGVATVRDMASGDQREVPLDQLAEALR
jgi:histidyl-tRNA synthetase